MLTHNSKICTMITASVYMLKETNMTVSIKALESRFKRTLLPANELGFAY